MMIAPTKATAEWLNTAGHQLRAYLDTEMPVGTLVTMTERTAFYLLAQGMLDQRDALLRAYASDPNVIAFPPRHKGERVRLVDTWGGGAPGGAA